jgi:CheY-like chemotaxis protein
VSLGFSVRVVDSADEFAAVPTSELATFSLVVIDVMLRLGTVLKGNEAPETGIAIFRRLRKTVPKMPVLFLTALQRTDVAQMAILDEKTAYHGKPIPKDFSTLEATLRHLVKGGR